MTVNKKPKHFKEIWLFHSRANELAELQIQTFRVINGFIGWTELSSDIGWLSDWADGHDFSKFVEARETKYCQIFFIYIFL